VKLSVRMGSPEASSLETLWLVVRDFACPPLLTATPQRVVAAPGLAVSYLSQISGQQRLFGVGLRTVRRASALRTVSGWDFDWPGHHSRSVTSCLSGQCFVGQSAVGDRAEGVGEPYPWGPHPGRVRVSVRLG